jgi:hypothetical protein
MRHHSQLFNKNFLIKNYFFIINGCRGTDECPLCSKAPDVTSETTF